MAKLRFKIAMSLDGHSAGPHQSKKNPLGVGGERLHEWAFPLAAWRAMHGLEGGVVVPTLLGAGERLFDSVDELDGLRLVRTVAAPGVTHMKFVKA